MSNVRPKVKIPLSTQRFRLPYSTALLQCLDENRQPIPGAYATGFVRREGGALFLYTCWHVVTGFDPNDVRIGTELPNRRYLQVALQAAEHRAPGVQVIGGLQNVVIPLYASSSLPLLPLWLQDDRHRPHVDLNAVGLCVPFWHDLVKIELPSSIVLSDMQVISEGSFLPGSNGLLTPGDKCLVVGYPYGFSAVGPNQPTAVVLTRFVAASNVLGRPRQLLLESMGAPAMSGAPVYVERGNDLHLFGVYTGLIYPDHERRVRSDVTALGAVADISFILWGHLPLVTTPSEVHAEA
jgi:hypothetical protein